jgi:hypothetical protein
MGKKNYSICLLWKYKKYNDWQIFLATTCLQAPCRTVPPCSTYSRQHDHLHSRDPETLALFGTWLGTIRITWGNPQSGCSLFRYLRFSKRATVGVRATYATRWNSGMKRVKCGWTQPLFHKVSNTHNNILHQNVGALKCWRPKCRRLSKCRRPKMSAP